MTDQKECPYRGSHTAKGMCLGISLVKKCRIKDPEKCRIYRRRLGLNKLDPEQYEEE